MRLIKKLADHEWDDRDYMAYVEHVIRELRPDLWPMLRPERYEFDSPESMHAARLKRFSQCAWNDDGDMTMDMVVEFEGPYEDRIFILTYRCAYKFNLEKNDAIVMPLELMTHELEICDDHIVHRMAFAGGSEWEIYCEDIGFEEQII